MALRAGHGRGAGQPRVEVLPVDELPEGISVMAPEPQASAGAPERRPNGHFLKGAKTAQSKGGRAVAGQSKLARMLGAVGVDTDAAFQPYKRLAVGFRKSHVQALARNVGGGICGAAPASMIESAALQLAASRYLFDTANGDAKKLKLASQMSNDSRQNLLAAHELCAKEAKARQAAQPDNWRSDFERALGGGNPESSGGDAA